MAEIRIFPDGDLLAAAAADRFVFLAGKAIGERGRFSVALSGGSTPTATYATLATEENAVRVDWSKVHVFWGDERCVPPDHPGSSFRMAGEALLDLVPLPGGNIHRVRGELAPEEAARAYAAELHSFFGGEWPSFDLVLLGVGSDGHTASLFPGSPALDEKGSPVVVVMAYYEDRPAQRVSLTVPAINAARQVIFLVAGPSKAGIVSAVLEGPPGRYPAQLIQPAAGHLIWMMDAAAAGRLQGGH
jgi:6-phosphogluconolactonase